MGWREELLPASFRGANFFVDSSDSDFGRRQVDHSFPGRDDVYTEDNGRATDGFVIEGYVLGDDYKIARDAIISACRDVAGPGVLVHPYYGQRSVSCKGIRVRGTRREGGFATISITFKESGDKKRPLPVEDAPSTNELRRQEVNQAAGDSFEAEYVAEGQPGFSLASVSEKLQALVDFVEGQPLLALIDEAAEFAYQIRELGALADDLAAAPDLLRSRLTDAFELGRSAFSNALESFTSIFDDDDGNDDIPVTTSTRVQQKQNLDAFTALVRQLCLSQMSQEAVETTYTSAQDAYNTRDSILDRIDSELASNITDESFEALTSLRAQVVRGVPPQDQAIPFVIEYTPTASLPSIVIAQTLYGDANRGLEIVDRNDIRHPGFVPGGVPLQVLSDG